MSSATILSSSTIIILASGINFSPTYHHDSLLLRSVIYFMPSQEDLLYVLAYFYYLCNSLFDYLTYPPEPDIQAMEVGSEKYLRSDKISIVSDLTSIIQSHSSLMP